MDEELEKHYSEIEDALLHLEDHEEHEVAIKALDALRDKIIEQALEITLLNNT